MKKISEDKPIARCECGGVATKATGGVIPHKEDCMKFYLIDEKQLLCEQMQLPDGAQILAK